MSQLDELESKSALAGNYFSFNILNERTEKIVNFNFNFLK